MKDIIVECKISEKEYRAYLLQTIYRKPIVMLAVFLAALQFAIASLYFLHTGVYFTKPPYFQLIFGFIVIFIFPVIIAWQGKKAYKAIKIFHERLKYQFSDNTITVKGDTFKNEFEWNKLLKVVEWKHWLLLYQDKYVAYPIPKEAIGEQITNLRTLIKNKPDVKSQLKKK